MNNSLIYPDAPRCPVPEGGLVDPRFLDKSWRVFMDTPITLPPKSELEELLRSKTKVTA